MSTRITSPPPTPTPRTERATITVQAVCDRYKISRSTFYRKVRSGQIRAFRWDGRTLVYEDEVASTVAMAAATQPLRRSP